MATEKGKQSHGIHQIKTKTKQGSFVNGMLPSNFFFKANPEIRSATLVSLNVLDTRLERKRFQQQQNNDRKEKR